MREQFQDPISVYKDRIHTELDKIDLVLNYCAKPKWWQYFLTPPWWAVHRLNQIFKEPDSNLAQFEESLSYKEGIKPLLAWSTAFTQAWLVLLVFSLCFGSGRANDNRVSSQNSGSSSGDLFGSFLSVGFWHFLLCHISFQQIRKLPNFDRKRQVVNSFENLFEESVKRLPDIEAQLILEKSRAQQQVFQQIISSGFVRELSPEEIVAELNKWSKGISESDPKGFLN